ncbi:Isochorismatase hydrolase [Venturia nashicola]|uniref:Isochorismatase hydrolase n=1 Tax=Venturia nashicola TaxID=86259 RepID=A0A4Z1PVW9_9PEZI|nr:Isochorismatase hydrolase [Venturia nashicola]TLD39105.1 Isochorismatase hydrolase [Venturia nashicola]
MAAKIIVPSQTALLLLDLQTCNAADPTIEALIQHTASVVEMCRDQGITIAHCRVAFTESEMASIPDTNPVFSKAKHDPMRAAMYHVNSEGSAFHSAVAPQKGDIVVRKNRVGPFLNAPQDVHAIFTDRGINTLIIGGLSTGGAVAATVVQGADLDYRLFVLEDCCADPNQETHEFLMKYFAKRGAVISSKYIEGLVG